MFLRLSSKHMMVLSLSLSQQSTISEMQAREALEAKEVIRLIDDILSSSPSRLLINPKWCCCFQSVLISQVIM